MKEIKIRINHNKTNSRVVLLCNKRNKTWEIWSCFNNPWVLLNKAQSNQKSKIRQLKEWV